MKKLLLSLGVLFFATVAVAQKSIQTSNTIKVEESDTPEIIIKKAAHVVPTSNQLAALKNEFIAFIHFGSNTFTQMEWGTGKEDPAIFDLKTLNTDQWCQAMKDAGMEMVILTVKHHDGFVLWQSRYTKQGIMSTGFQNGKGDILRDLSNSCAKYGLKLGVYLSPADLYQIEHPDGLYGNLSKYIKRTIPREVPGRPFKNKTTFEFEVDDYNEYFLNQLFETLTEYGEIHEVWFDGAHPKTKGGQQYNYKAWKELIHTLAPKAVIFGKEDIRWCGNESGGTRDTEWNVIPYQDNPNTLNSFPDLTGKDLGSREKLYGAKYLHYQQAETNTSIREGWFYRDDTHQKVRSADDVFDIYERSVGGNTTFLLNIPPNREGKFSAEDVSVLEEVGKRIRETYGVNLLHKAKGIKRVLDNNPDSYYLLKNTKQEMIFTLRAPEKINRIVLQEAIATHGERVEKHAVDAWINNQWEEIATATNIGYKRILRFPEVTTSKIRIRVLESRCIPAFSHVSAHYYRTRPPRLAFTRDINGMVTIAPLQHEFNWKPHGENSAENLNQGYEVYYTLDGTNPTRNSQKYSEPIKVENQELRAVSFSNEEKGEVQAENFGLIKKVWELHEVSGQDIKNKAEFAFDVNPKTYWQSAEGTKSHSLAIDFGKSQTIQAMVYTPPKLRTVGLMAKAKIQISNDGQTWETIETAEFGNLINDPSPRTHRFANKVTTRFVRLEIVGIEGNQESVSISEVDFL